jgi:two-component system, chemotaxis family, chemotaxis protein CheY
MIAAMSRPTSALIVDDEPHVRTFLRLLLKEVGIEKTWEARDGAQALGMVALHKPELVLLDLNLPVMGGLEVLEQLQQLQPGTPVIVVSSLSAMKTVLETARLGAITYLLKQSPKEQMLESLRQALDSLAAPTSGESEATSEH